MNKISYQKEVRDYIMVWL